MRDTPTLVGIKQNMDETLVKLSQPICWDSNSDKTHITLSMELRYDSSDTTITLDGSQVGL